MESVYVLIWNDWINCMSYFLQPHIRIWDSVSLNTLKVIGIGDFDRAVACLGFSKAVSSLLIVLEVFSSFDSWHAS